MKASQSITLLTILLAAAGGFFAWELTDSPTADQSAIETAISNLKAEFRRKTRPSYQLDIESVLSIKRAPELLDPKTTLPHYHEYDYEEAQRLLKLRSSCRRDTGAVGPDLKKAFLWEGFLCRHQVLPGDFFSTDPFMHPSGRSYVSLAVLQNLPVTKMKDWAYEHRRFQHLREVLPLHLSAWELKTLLSREDFVLTKEYALFGNVHGEKDEARKVYAIYDANQWNQFISSKKFRTSVDVRSPYCLVKDGNVCWVANVELKNASLRWFVILLSSSLGLLGLYLALLAARKTKRDRKEADQRLFILQMLTHELRTPATALKLSSETLRKDFDHLPVESQKALLRILEDLQRLDRVVEASKMYLKLGGETEDETLERFPANELLESVLSGYGSEVRFVALNEEVEVKLNRYWVELCLKNLIENGLHHGKSPVTVKLHTSGKDFVVSVEDFGDLDARLSDLAKPLAKGSQSQGMGLGLTIVQKVMDRLNGDLTLSTKPTRFTLRFRSCL